MNEARGAKNWKRKLTLPSVPTPSRGPAPLCRVANEKKRNVGDCVQTNSASLIFISSLLPGRNCRRALDAVRKPGKQPCDVLPLPSGPLTHPICSLNGETLPVSSFALPRLTSYPCLPHAHISSRGAGLCSPPHSGTFKLQEELQVG